jgi:hypothetical protein
MTAVTNFPSPLDEQLRLRAIEREREKEKQDAKNKADLAKLLWKSHDSGLAGSELDRMQELAEITKTPPDALSGLAETVAKYRAAEKPALNFAEAAAKTRSAARSLAKAKQALRKMVERIDHELQDSGGLDRVAVKSNTPLPPPDDHVYDRELATMQATFDKIAERYLAAKAESNSAADAVNARWRIEQNEPFLFPH